MSGLEEEEEEEEEEGEEKEKEEEEEEDSLCKSKMLVNLLKTEVYLNYQYVGKDPKSIKCSVKCTITYVVNSFVID
jgi:hypothetical protein